MRPFEEGEFVNIAKILNYNNRKRHIGIKLFVEKWGIKETWKWLCQTEKFPPEYDTVKRMKYRMQKDLQNYLNQQQK